MSNKYLELNYHALFVTANTFFGSKAAARARGFDSVEKMDEAIVKALNSVVPESTRATSILHLGNVAVARKERVNEILSQLRAPILLCRGKFDGGLVHRNIRLVKTLVGTKALAWHDRALGLLCGGYEHEAHVRRTLSKLTMIPCARGIFLVSSDAEAQTLLELDSVWGSSWKSSITAVVDLRITGNANYGENGTIGKMICVNTELNPEPVGISRLAESYRGPRRYAQRDDRPASEYGFVDRIPATLHQRTRRTIFPVADAIIGRTFTATATTQNIVFDGARWRNVEAATTVNAGTITGRLEAQTPPAPAQAPHGLNNAINQVGDAVIPQQRPAHRVAWMMEEAEALAAMHGVMGQYPVPAEAPHPGADRPVIQTEYQETHVINAELQQAIEDTIPVPTLNNAIDQIGDALNRAATVVAVEAIPRPDGEEGPYLTNVRLDVEIADPPQAQTTNPTLEIDLPNENVR